jgi:hypothetical protein
MRTVLRMLALPMRVEWRRGRGRFGLGPEVRYLLDARRDNEDVIRTAIGVAPNLAQPAASSIAQVAVMELPMVGSVTNLYSRWSIGVSGALGIKLPMDHHTTCFDMRWSEGLTNISKMTGAPERTRAVQFGVGLLW